MKRRITGFLCLLLACCGWQAVHADGFDPTLPPEPMTKYAVTVSADPAAGAASLSGAGKYTAGSAITISQTAQADYQFEYWTLNGVEWATTASFQYTVGDSAAHFVAHYTSTTPQTPEEQQVGIIVSADPAEGGTVSGTGVYTSGSYATISATANSNYGWSFDYWNKDGAYYGSAATFSYQVGTEPAEFVAHFSYTEFDPMTPTEPIAKYRVYTSAMPSGAATTSGDGAYNLGSTVNIKATTQSGWQFVHWTLNGHVYSNALSFNYTVGDSVAYFVAVYERLYAVSVQTNPSTGAGTVNGAGSYLAGTVISVSVTQQVPYVFDYWMLNGERTDNAQSFSYTVGDSAALFVAYMRDTTDNTFVPVTPPEPLVYTRITATAPENYYFVSWNDGNTDNPRMVLLSEAENYTPIFAPIDFAVAVDATICSNEFYRLGDQRLTLSGVYKATLQSSLGSDSVVTLNLTVHPSYLFTTVDTINDGGSVLFGDTLLTTAGIYRKSYKTQAGCDSIYQHQVILISDSAYITTFSRPAIGGEVTGGGYYHKGSTATLVAVPSTGWHFVRWQDGETEATRQVVVTEEMQYVASFAINRYEVLFVDWDGTVLRKDSVEYGSAVNAPSGLSRVGYTFTGWDKTFDAITGDLTITAQYTINTFTVQFLDWDGTILLSAVLDYGSTITAPANPTRDGYTFTGWDKTFSIVYGDLIITAQYSLNSYTVQFVDWDGRVLKTQTVTYGASATAPNNPSRTGYTFTGWSSTYTYITGDLVVTAQYAAITYTVTFVDWNGTVLKSETVNYGTAATAPTDPTREGYTFTGWSRTFNNVTSNITVTAQYSINSYTVQFVDWDGTVLKTQTVTYGAAATAPSDPTREGYRFTGWDKAFNYVSSDLVVTATYMERPSGNDTLCFYQLVLTDYYNDGWDNNGQIRVTDGSHEMYYRCEYGQSPTRIDVPYYGDEVTIRWVSGSATGENSITVLASNGMGLFYYPEGTGMNDGQLLFTMTESPCRSEENPYCPQNIQAVVHTNKTMTVSWDAVQGAAQYAISIISPDATTWYQRMYVTGTSFTTDALSLEGDYTIMVTSVNADGVPLGESQLLFNAQLPPIATATVDVLVPTDCDMDISNGLWIYWWVPNTEEYHYEAMTALEGRHFTATLNPNAASYCYFVLNAENLNMADIQYTSSIDNITTDTHCSEVYRSPYDQQYSLSDAGGCGLIDHDYRPLNTSAVVEEGAVTLYWQQSGSVSPSSVVLYIDYGSYTSTWSFYGASFDGTQYSVKCVMSNTDSVKVLYWAVRYYINGTSRVYGHEDGFTVPANSLLPTNLMASDNGDNTYTLTWQKNSEYTQKISVLGIVHSGSYREEWIVSDVPVTGNSYTTPDVTGYEAISWKIYLYDENNSYIGQASSDFYITSQDPRTITLHVYVPDNADFASAGEGFALQWNYSGFAKNTVPLVSEGNNWYQAELTNITQSYIYVSVLNALSPETATMSVAYPNSINESRCLIVNRDERGEQFLGSIASSYYPNDYLPYNLQAEPSPGKVSLSFETNESSRYYLQIFDENGSSVWSWWSSYDDNWDNQVDATLSYDTEKTFTWVIRTRDNSGNSYNSATFVYGGSFTVPPSPYIPQNLQAVYNGDGTCTVTWTPQGDIEEIAEYVIRIDGPRGTTGWAYPTRGQSTAVVSFTLDASGEYTATLWPMDSNGNELARAITSFNVPAVAERDITVRILVQPSSSYDTSNGVSLLIIEDEWPTVMMTPEGNGWYTYTLTTSSPGVRISIDNYNSYQVVSRDTCLEYTSYLHFVDCDARIMDYTPYNLQAEPGAGFVTLSWDAQDQAQRYDVALYLNGSLWGSYDYYEKQATISLSNTDTMTFTWSVRPYKYGWVSDAVYGEEFTVAPSPYIPQNVQAIDNNDGTFTVTWDPIDLEGVQYGIIIFDSYWNNVSELWGFSSTAYRTDVLPVAGSYNGYLYVYDSNWNEMSYAYFSFEVPEAEPRDITIRVLIHPDSRFDTSNGVEFAIYNNSTNDYDSYPAVDEGGHWYSYTFTTTDRALKFKLGSRYMQGIASDTCLQFTSRLSPAACDAVAHDYRIIPESMTVVSVPGRIDFSWEAVDIADSYWLEMRDSATNNYITGISVYGTEYSIGVMPQYDSTVVTWSIYPTYPIELYYAPVSGTAMLHKSEVELTYLRATTTDSVTYHFSWESNTDNLLYVFTLSYNGADLVSDTVSELSDNYTLPYNGVYYWSVQAIDPSDKKMLGGRVYGDDIVVSACVEPIANLETSVEGRTITYTWEMNVPRVIYYLYRITSDGSWYWLMESEPSNVTSIVYDADVDGVYRLELRACIETAPGQYTGTGYWLTTDVRIFAGETYTLQVTATEGGFIYSPNPSGEYAAGFRVEVGAYPYEHYHFVEWSDGYPTGWRYITITSDTTITAIFEKDRYTVTFLNEDGSLIEEEEWEYGSIPYCSETPVKESTDAVTYVFAGWSPQISAVTENVTYTAVFTEIPIHTDVERVEQSADPVYKILRNDQIFILRGDKIYTLTGQEVK